MWSSLSVVELYNKNHNVKLKLKCVVFFIYLRVGANISVCIVLISLYPFYSFYVFFPLKSNSFLIQYSQPQFLLPSLFLASPHSPFSQIQSPQFSLQERADLQEMIVRQGKIRYYKNRQKPLC